MEPLVVRPARAQSILIAVLGVLWIPFPLAGLYYGLTRDDARVTVLSALLLAPFCALVWTMRPGRPRNLRLLTGEGLERNDGVRLSWSDLERVTERVYVGRGGDRQGCQRVDLHFRGRRVVRLFPASIDNFDEVAGFVRRLPSEHTVKEVFAGRWS